MPHSLHNPRGSSAARGLSVCRPDATCVLLCTVCVAFFWGGRLVGRLWGGRALTVRGA